MSKETGNRRVLWRIRAGAMVAVVAMALAGHPEASVAFQCEDYFMDCTSFVRCTDVWHDECPMGSCTGEIQCNITDECQSSEYPITMSCQEVQPN